jgi:hypothetical protein
MIKFWSEMLFVFFADMLLDIFSVKFTLSANAKPARAGRAAFWSVMIALDAGLSTIVFVDNYWTILSGAAGAAIGTYWTLKHAQRKNEADQNTEG